MDWKKISNIAFYVILLLAVLFFLKRKFIVPQLSAEELKLSSYSSGEAFSVSDIEKDLVVVNFWQTWCGPCVHEMPSLNEMEEVWGGIEVICVSDEPLEKVSSFIAKYPNIKFASVDNIPNLGVTQFPTTYIYNKKGVKVYSKVGSKDWSDPNFIATLKKNWSN